MDLRHIERLVEGHDELLRKEIIEKIEGQLREQLRKEYARAEGSLVSAQRALEWVLR